MIFLGYELFRQYTGSSGAVNEEIRHLAVAKA